MTATQNCYKMVSAKQPECIGEKNEMSSYKMETPDPQSTEWIAGNSPLFSRSTQLEHKWKKTRTQLEHKWNTHPKNGTQPEHNWNTCRRSASRTQVEHNWDTSGTQLVHASHVTTPFENKVLQNGIPRPPVYRMDCWKN